jgi:hypothetical protein
MFLSILFLLKCWSFFFHSGKKKDSMNQKNDPKNSDKGGYAGKPGLNKRAIHCINTRM